MTSEPSAPAELNPNSDLEVPEALLSAKELVRRVHANDPDLTLDQLKIVRDSPIGLQCLVSHPSASDDLIASLAIDGSWTVRQSAAGSFAANR